MLHSDCAVGLCCTSFTGQVTLASDREMKRAVSTPQYYCARRVAQVCPYHAATKVIMKRGETFERRMRDSGEIDRFGTRVARWVGLSAPTSPQLATGALHSHVASQLVHRLLSHWPNFVSPRATLYQFITKVYVSEYWECGCSWSHPQQCWP